MRIPNPNPWETTTLSALIPLPPPHTHRLHLSTSGPPRRHPSHPVLLFFTGAGAPCAAHPRLQSLLSTTHRVYFPDRSGYDRSDAGPYSRSAPLTAQASAVELAALLRAVRVGPPYVLVAHSYGGIVAREFLALSGAAAIAGMALVDTATELTYALHPRIPPLALETMAAAAGVDWAALTHLREESGMTDAEWREAVAAVERTVGGAEREDARGSGGALAGKRQFERRALGDAPVLVVRSDSAGDYWRLFEEAVRRGGGTEEERGEARGFLGLWGRFDDELKAGQLRLSSRASYKYVGVCGHDIVIRRPEIVAEEIVEFMKQIET